MFTNLILGDYSINFFPYAFVGRKKDAFGGHVEGPLEDENARHDADGVGGRPLEDQVVRCFHFYDFSRRNFRKEKCLSGTSTALHLFFASTSDFSLHFKFNINKDFKFFSLSYFKYFECDCKLICSFCLLTLRI